MNEDFSLIKNSILKILVVRLSRIIIELINDRYECFSAVFVPTKARIKLHIDNNSAPGRDTGYIQ